MADTPDKTGQPHQLVLQKNEERWVLRYGSGEEGAVLTWLARSAKDPQCDLDWFDAAVLSHQMGDQIAAQLKNLMKSNAVTE